MRFFFEHIRLLARLGRFLGVNDGNDPCRLTSFEKRMAQWLFIARYSVHPMVQNLMKRSLAVALPVMTGNPSLDNRLAQAPVG
jgi:hypothetical protein